MNPEVETLKQFYAAINRNDMPAVTRDFDPQIVRIDPKGSQQPAPIAAARTCRRM